MTPELITAVFACPSCRGSLFARAFTSRGGALVDGSAVCASCQTAYRIEGGVAEMLPPRLQDRARGEAFAARHGAAAGSLRGAAPADPSRPDDEHKLEQKSFYDEDAVSYETSMLRLSFWQAFDRTFRRRFLEGAGGVLVEIGCGTGRVSLPCRASFKCIIGFDISESMVRTAVAKRDALPGSEHVEYFVADAENIPLKDGTADMVVFSGILHHVENPGRVIAEALRVLKPGGRYWGLENNRSAMRPLFDLLMRVSKIWNEKAHEDHFIMSGREIRQWLSEAVAGSGVSSEVWTSVFLPPHFFNLLSPEKAESLLVASDALMQRVPWLRDQGGLVLFTGRKP